MFKYHFWLSFQREILIFKVTAAPSMGIEMAHESSILPSITSVIKQEKLNEFQRTHPENVKFYDCTEIKEEVSFWFTVVYIVILRLIYWR